MPEVLIIDTALTAHMNGPHEFLKGGGGGGTSFTHMNDPLLRGICVITGCSIRRDEQDESSVAWFSRKPFETPRKSCF